MTLSLGFLIVDNTRTLYLSKSKEIGEPSKAELRAFTFDEAKTVVDNDRYSIQDLNLYDSRGRVVFTLSVTVLHIGKQTKGHSHPQPHENEVYEFIEGNGIMMIDTSALNVKAGDYIFVEAGRFHKVINISNASDLVFRCYFAGQIRRPHLGSTATRQ